MVASWAKLPLAVLDTETTGLEAEQGDRVIELGVVLFDDGEVVERWGVLIDPERDLPKDASRVTGITEADLVGQPTFDRVAADFVALLEGRLLVAYNASFDRRFIIHELARCQRSLPDGATWLDPLVFAKELQKGQGNMKLGTVAKRLGIPLEEAHRATADAEAAGHVLVALSADLPDDLEQVLDLQEQWEAAQAAQRAVWRNRRKPGQVAIAASAGPKDELGPGYPHGDELDPVRYMFLRGTGRV